MSDLIKNIDIQKVIEITRYAGLTIRKLQGKVQSENKSDGSPVTLADRKASQIIIEGLSKLTPDIPVISEEESEQDNLKAAKSDLRWIVDPLDGTKTFLSGHDGYGCHVALVDGEDPVLGIVFFPSLGENGILYYTDHDGKAYKKEWDEKAVSLQVVNSSDSKKLKASIGWSDRVTKIFNEVIDPVCAVGGGRLCITAEGKADFAWLNGVFSQWDVAAAHAILKAAGGEVVEIETGKPVKYKQDRLHVPPMAGGHISILKRLKLFPKDKDHGKGSPKP